MPFSVVIYFEDSLCLFASLSASFLSPCSQEHPTWTLKKVQSVDFQRP
jgi:hypothetical protein